MRDIDGSSAHRTPNAAGAHTFCTWFSAETIYRLEQAWLHAVEPYPDSALRLERFGAIESGTGSHRPVSLFRYQKREPINHRQGKHRFARKMLAR